MPAEVLANPIRFKFPHLVAAPKPMAQLGSAGLIDTFGWDTVFGIKMPDVNTAIRKNASSPPSFTKSNSYGGATATASGNFNIWQLTQGGSGSTLFMSVPIPSGTLNFAGTDYPFVDAVATISVHLEFVPQAPLGAKGTPNALMVKTKQSFARDAVSITTRSSAGSRKGSAAAAVLSLQVKPVTVEDLTFTGVQPSSIVGPFLRDLLELWFADNMDKFQHTFAVVDLDAIASLDAWTWMKPTSVLYAYVQPAGTAPDDQCVFGVLCMTGNRSTTGLSQQIDANIIPAGARAGFLISAERYMDQVLAPGLSQAFNGAKVADFALVPGTAQLTNVNAVTMNQLNGYTPQVAAKDFTVEIKAGELQISLKKAHVPISAGIDLYLNYTIHAGAKLIDQASGQKALQLYDTQDVEYDHEVQVASWVTITEVVAGIIAGIVLTAVGSVAGRAASRALVAAGRVAEDSFCAKFVKWLISVVIGGVIGGLVASISTIIEANAEANAEALPPFDPFAKEAVSTTQWPGAGSNTVLQTVSFNGGFQIGLDPKFAE